MGRKPHKTVLFVSSLLECALLCGQTIIADSNYISSQWSVEVVTAFGASEYHERRLTGGNPDAYRYMEHHLPAPPGPTDLTFIEVTHIYNGDAYLALDPIDHIDYAEDIRLLDLPWEQAFMVSYPAIRQDGKLFRTSDRRISVIADTLWTSGSLTGLKADDFIALDGSGDKPDFSDQGDFLYFGFWRVSSRGATLPPIPPGDLLTYRHGSDNFTVTIHGAPPPNQPPVARQDDYLYLDHFFNTSTRYVLLRNDYDPEGDPIHIYNVDEPAFGGTIQSFNDSSVVYQFDDPGVDTDFFLYQITDGMNPSQQAFVTLHFCFCPLECIQLFLAEPPDFPRPPLIQHAKETRRSHTDSLDLALFRRFRDEVLLPTGPGAAFVDLYYHYAPELMPLFLIHRRPLGQQAFHALGLMQEPIRNLLDGDSSAVITQELIDSVSAFLDSLILASSDTLRDALDSALVLLCPLQDLVGLTTGEAASQIICDTMSTAMHDPSNSNPNTVHLQQNYPNPFPASPSSASMYASTRITYSLMQSARVHLAIYNTRGRRIRTLVDAFQHAGEHTAYWDGKDHQGVGMEAGIYFYQLRTPTFIGAKGMILLR